MNLESISIQRFRSVQSEELKDFGGFNVLIGKNNSGKSNILSAIDTFFNCIEEGNVATLTPPFGDEIDFFNRNTQMPIEIVLSFLLSLPERDLLLQDIIREAPQMQNATEDISPSLRLFAAIKITAPPKKFGFISNLSIQNISQLLGGRQYSKTILNIADEAGIEIYDQLSRSHQLNQDVEDLRQFIKSDRIRYLFSSPDPRRPIRPSVTNIRDYFPQLRLELRKSLESMFSEVTSPEELIRVVEAFATTRKEEAEAVQAETLKNKVRTFAGEEASIPEYAQNLLLKLAQIKLLHLKERRDPIGNEEAERILRLKTQRGGTEKLHNIQEPVETLLGVKIDAFEAENEQSLPRLRSPLGAELDVDNFLVSVNGSGIREALRVILDVEFEKPQILLVEEPEIHLHPALETSMMRYLKRISSECQVFLTTHSTNFLDTAEMKNVYLVSKNESTHVQHIDLEEAESLVPKELGLRLSSLFMFDRLIFVEGDSDEGILREWASRLKVNLSQFNVGFVIMEGVHNFTHYAQERLLSLLTKRQVKMLFLLDRDEREDAEISRLKERCGDNATLAILNRREIENYLICPRAIADFIKIKREKSGSRNTITLPTEHDIKSAIDECAEELKQLAVEKRVVKVLSKPFYPSRKRLLEEKIDTPITSRLNEEVNRMIEQLETVRNKVEMVHRETIDFINKNWDANKSFLVPGDLLIDKVCQRYGVRFRKEHEGAQLAALMAEHEIDPEIKGIIHKIAS